MSEKAAKGCTARQANRRAPDFGCDLTVGHTIHKDPRTGTRWGEGSRPRGWNRRWCKSYANPKLTRRSLAMGRAR